MIKESLKSIGIMLKYARAATIIKLFELLITALMAPLALYFTQKLIDSISPFVRNETTITSIIIWSSLLLVSMLFSANVNAFNGIQYINMKRKLNQNFTKIIINKYKKLDYSCFEDSEIQDTLTRMGDAPQEKIFNLFLNITGTISMLITITGLAIIFIQVSIWFPFAFLTILIFMMWLDFKSMDMMNNMFNNQTEEERRLSYLSGLLSDKASLFELRIFGAVSYIIAKWRGMTGKILNERLQITIKSHKYFAVSSVCILAWIALVVFSLIYGIDNGAVTLGLFVSLVGATGGILTMTEMLSHAFANLSQRYLQMKHFDIFMALPEISDNESEDEIKNPIIKFEDVVFIYPKTGKNILNGVTFTISANEKVAIVGENGAGKSTIIKLLCRLYKPDSGKITINDEDINDLSQKQLRSVFSVVFQDFANYSLALRENVAFGNIGKLHKKYNALQIISKVYRQTLRIIPVSGILSQIYYLINGLFPAAVVIITAKLFDSVYRYINGSSARPAIITYACILLGCYAIKQLLQFVSSITINAGVYEKCSSYNNIRIAEKASRLPLLSYENSEILSLQTRAKDCASRGILSQLYMTISVFITSGIGALTVIGVLAGYSIWFVPISIFSVLPYFIAQLIRGKEFYYIKRGQAKKTRRLDYLWGLFTGRQTIKEMRVMGFDDYITDKWVECRDEVNEELWDQGKKDALSLLLCDVFRVIGYGISIALALVLVLSGDISIGLFGACIGAFISVQGQIGSFLAELGGIPSMIEFANDYYEFLDLPEEDEGSTSYNGLKNVITLSGVSFKYPNCENYAVKNAGLTIKRGEKIAILGENGSGKTTIAKLILGLYLVNEGEVMYDGINVNEFDKSSLYKKVSAIAQNFVSYNLTLRENIGIADTENIHDDEKLYNVLEDAGLSSLLREVALDDELGKMFGGAALSGGQWQKIAIARGLFKDSELIILDEPTSALDPLIETEILSKFVEIAKEKTAIIISHRVGLCRLVDKVVVMKNGEIVEVGTHKELIKADSEYARLYTVQEQWYR